MLKGNIKTCKHSNERDLSLLTFIAYEAQYCKTMQLPDAQLYRKWADYFHSKVPFLFIQYSGIFACIHNLMLSAC